IRTPRKPIRPARIEPEFEDLNPRRIRILISKYSDSTKIRFARHNSTDGNRRVSIFNRQRGKVKVEIDERIGAD
ncbi:MAG: hypothetical protein ACREJC_13965, partial [Tepidisphaeraceae bacterium]